MKLCITCNHRLDSEAMPDDPEYSRCGFERPISPVTGLIMPIGTLPYCSVNRASLGGCKPTAENWEAADHVMTPEEEEEMLKEAKYV